MANPNIKDHSKKHGWKKGQSGNPGGRPKIIIEVARAAREYTMQALNTLVSAMTNKDAPWAAKVSAASVILDRGWGKAPQHIEITRRLDPKALTDADLASIAAGGIEPPASSGDFASPQSDKRLIN